MGNPCSLSLTVVGGVAYIAFMLMNQSKATLLASVSLLGATLCQGLAGADAPTPFPVTYLDTVDAQYATFSSHNHKIVQNQYGIFMTYWDGQADDLGNWKLVRSLDQGASWGTIAWESTSAKPPVLVGDVEGSVFLIWSDRRDMDKPETGRPARFRRFDPEDGFKGSSDTLIPDGASDKFTAIYDRDKGVIYYLSFMQASEYQLNFYELDRLGNVMFSRSALVVPDVMMPAPFPYPIYPHLTLAGDRLYAAFTTTLSGGDYRTIYYLWSDDEGRTWRSPLGQLPGPPAPGSYNGSGCQAINLPDEANTRTWLASFIEKWGELHFAYQASDLGRQHYMRFGPENGSRISDTLQGWSVANAGMSMYSLYGFFASDRDPATPLFFVGEAQDRVVAIASDHPGATWNLHASSDPAFSGPTHLWSTSGSPDLTRSGHILGQTMIDGLRVYAFRIPAVRRTAESSWDFFTINPNEVTLVAGMAYRLSRQFAHGHDSWGGQEYSRLRVFEDGRELGPSHSMHADIIAYGGGRFSYWERELRFSASDGSDPHTNGRTYRVAIPTIEGSQVGGRFAVPSDAISLLAGKAFLYRYSFGIRPDSADAPRVSRLRLFEDGIELPSPHSPHYEIQELGSGRYSYWNDMLIFSSRDGTDPRSSGHAYYVEEAPLSMYGRIRPAAIGEDGGAFIVWQDFGTRFDSAANSEISRLRLYEDGFELGPAHTTHSEIRTEGHGRYSHWQGALRFSTSDNSDPRYNGRVYTWSIEPDPTCYCGMLPIETAWHGDTNEYILPNNFPVAFDSAAAPYASPLRIFENGLDLGVGHEGHAEIRQLGGGRFSLWMNHLHFSSSDNTDPRTNHRIYTWGVSGECPSR